MIFRLNCILTFSVKVAYFMIKEIGFLQKLTKRTPLLDINYIVKVPVCFTWINSIIEMEFMYLVLIKHCYHGHPVLIKHCYHGHPVNFNFNIVFANKIACFVFLLSP